MSKVDPTVPRLGGPTSVGGSGAMLGDTVFTYGNSSLRQGIMQLRPKQGIVVQGDGQRLEPHGLHRDARAFPATRARAS